MTIKNINHPAQVLEALGVDTLEGEYQFNSETGELTVKGFTDKQIAAAEASLDIAALDAEEALQAVRARRAAEYPPMADYLDAIVKGDAVAKQAYIDACLAVKARYPKG